MREKISHILDKNYPLQILFVASVYTILGRLGFALSDGSGFAALIWPPAGASLYFIIRFGNRAWPGIFLGALLTMVISFPAIMENPLSIMNYPQLFTIAAGSTLQALFAGHLVNRV